MVEVLPKTLEQTVVKGAGEDTQYYKCEAITYDEKTGRVNSITFRQVILTSEE